MSIKWERAGVFIEKVGGLGPLTAIDLVNNNADCGRERSASAP